MARGTRAVGAASIPSNNLIETPSNNVPTLMTGQSSASGTRSVPVTCSRMAAARFAGSSEPVRATLAVTPARSEPHHLLVLLLQLRPLQIHDLAQRPRCDVECAPGRRLPLCLLESTQVVWSTIRYSGTSAG